MCAERLLLAYSKGQPRSMARPNSTLFCLSDSTAYGLLPTSSLVGAGSVVDTETQCVMVISCGGSLVKEGSTGKSIMELFQKYLSEATGLPSDDTPVVCGCVPAERSVPNRSWAVLQDGRATTSVKQARRSWICALIHTIPKGCTLTD